MEPDYTFGFDILTREASEEEQLAALSEIAGRAFSDLIRIKWEMKDPCLNFNVRTRVIERTKDKIGVAFECFNVT